MSSITSGVGIFSGIDRNSIITQLLAIDGRPKIAAQRQIAKLQKYQAALLDVSGKASGLRSIAQKFRTANIFQAARATSSDEAVLKATASNGAPVGQYSVTAARLASTQQVLTRGFSDTNVTGLGLSQITVEDIRGRMDRDTPLNELNGGNGISRETQITDRTGANYTVDLSRATTLNDVMTAINDATGGKVKASIGTTTNAGQNIYAGHGLTLTDSTTGTGSIVVSELGGTTTAADLGLLGSAAATLNGTRINTIGANTRLRTLNDGLGVGLNQGGGDSSFDFNIKARDGSNFNVDIGDVYVGGVRTKVASTTLGDVVNRINEAAGNSGKVTASIDPNGRLILTDNTGQTLNDFEITDVSGSAAADLGILGKTIGNTLTGSDLITKLNSVQTQRLLGGTGLASDPIRATLRTGEMLVFDELNVTGSVTDFINSFNNDAQNTVLPSGKRKLELSIDSSGTRFVLTDNTAGTGSLTVSDNAADALGLAQTSASGVIRGGRTQRQYLNGNSLLSEMNGGRGIGEGRFEITTSTGRRFSVNVTSSQKTLDDLISQIRVASNNTPPDISVSLNDTGDGIIIREATPGQGANKITITDTTGSVARGLGLAGTATGTGASNFLNGTSERTVTLDPADNLDKVKTKLNDAGVGLTASIINDGGANPFRLSLTSRNSGLSGALSIDTGGIDLGLSTISQGRNALMFYGSSNAAQAVAIESSSNSIANAIPGVTIDLLSVSNNPINVGVTTDTEAIVKQINDFVTAYNALIDAIDSKSKYDSESNTRGELLGDGNAIELRRSMQDLIQRKAFGVSSQFQFVSQAGLKLGRGSKLELDETKLREAIQADPRGVTDLFAGRVQAANESRRPLTDAAGTPIPNAFVTETVAGAITTKGVMEIFADEMDRFTKSVDGSLARRSKLIDDQVKTQNDRIANVDKRLEAKRKRLQAQFITMEQSIGRLQGQSSSLSAIRPVTV